MPRAPGRVAGQGGDGRGVLVPRAPASPRRGGPRRPGRPAAAARPSHRSRQPRQSAERKRSRTGAAASTTSIRHGAPSGATPTTSCGRVVGWSGVGGDGAEPAQDLRRRLAHGTFDGAPGSSSSSSADLDHAAPVAAPAAHHLVDVAGRAPPRPRPRGRRHGVVVEGLGLLRDGDVEAGEVAAAVAAVSRERSPAHGSPSPATAPRPSQALASTSPIADAGHP